MPIKIDYKKCCWKSGKCASSCCSQTTKCEGCVEACVVGALKRNKFVEFENKKCISCGACVQACKHGAITLIK